LRAAGQDGRKGQGQSRCFIARDCWAGELDGN
jgi:hypothetical protein